MSAEVEQTSQDVVGSPLEALFGAAGPPPVWNEDDELRFRVLKGMSSTKRTPVDSAEMEELRLRKAKMFSYQTSIAVMAFIESNDYKEYIAFVEEYENTDFTQLVEAIPEVMDKSQANEWLLKTTSRAVRVGGLLATAYFINGNLETAYTKRFKAGCTAGQEDAQWSQEAATLTELSTVYDALGRSKAILNKLLQDNFSLRLQIDTLKAFLGIVTNEMALMKLS